MRVVISLFLYWMRSGNGPGGGVSELHAHNCLGGKMSNIGVDGNIRCAPRCISADSDDGDSDSVSCFVTVSDAARLIDEIFEPLDEQLDLHKRLLERINYLIR